MCWEQNPPSPEKMYILILNTRNSCSERLSNLQKIIQMTYQLGSARLCCDNKQPLYLSDLKHKGLFLLVSCIHTESAEGPCLSSIGIQAADQQLSQILLYQYNRHL